LAAFAIASLLASGEPWTQPENHFLLNSSKACLVIIDMQNFSCAPENGKALPHIDDVVARINTLADFCRRMGVPVIWVRHNINITDNSSNAGLYPASMI
jgi:nicotinamidase-related amidase